MSGEKHTELGDCPFCGGTSSEDNACQMAKIETRSFKSAIGKTAYRVECGCGAAGPSDLVWGKANAAWNTRSSVNALPALLAALESVAPAPHAEVRCPHCESWFIPERGES